MIQQKLNDWVLNMLGNPELSTQDLKNAGLNAQNTSLLDEDIYKRSKLITDNPIFKNSEGNFDELKFHDFYQTAQYTYNMLANETYADDMYKEMAVYGKDDIFAPKELRRTFDETVKYTKTTNPNRTTTGLIRINLTTEPKLSVAEIAQTLKVLDNPVEAEKDWSKAIWKDSPNDSWFEDFFDTRVLAQWDSDGVHIDPLTGETVEHTKGLLKLNDNGTYYYENLDGRDVYGRTVLNKMDTLTTDGSAWNKYDFFDSDGLELKSITGTLAKNIALAGSMFIPYVGPWVAGLSVATLLAGLTGTMGKMLLGSDSPTLSALEGWAKSVNRQTSKSLYAQENTWCWENFISLIGDVAAQLKEQRFLFEFAPALIKGNKTLGWNGIDKLKSQKYADELFDKYTKDNATKFNNLVKNKLATSEDMASYGILLNATKSIAQKDVDKFLESYYKVGEILSKGYMTAITVGDTYGEAKYYGGASDLEATLFTLGYGAAELALLNSSIGEWILPELKASGLKRKAIIDALSEPVRKATEATTKEAKKEIAKNWFKKGADTARKLMTSGKGLSGQALSGGLSEGIEESTEELLADFTKACFNTVLWLLGDEGRMSAFDNMFDRYAMSFLGGAVGGGLTAVGTNFKNNVESLTHELATLELVYLLRNGLKNTFLESLNKAKIANPYISLNTTNNMPTLADAKNKSIDLEVKEAIRLLVEILDNLIKSEGLKISDNKFLDLQIFNDIRLAHLQTSPISSLFILNFNNICVDIFNTKKQIETILGKTTDTNKTLPEADLLQLTKLQEQLNNLRVKKDAYLNGDLAMDYISASLMDLTSLVKSKFVTAFFKDYAEIISKKSFESLSEDEIKELREKHKSWLATESKNDIFTAASLYLKLAKNSGVFILEFANNYSKIRQNKTLQDLIKTQAASNKLINSVIDLETGQLSIDDTDLWLQDLSKRYNNELLTTVYALLNNYASEELKTLIKSIQELAKATENKVEELQLILQINNLFISELAHNIEKYLSEFINIGTINPEIKRQLVELTDVTLQSLLNNLKVFNTLLEFLNELEKLGITEDISNESLFDILNSMSEVSDIMEEILGGSFPAQLSQVANNLKLPNKNIEDWTLLDALNLKQQITEMLLKVMRVGDDLKNTSYTDTIKFILDFVLKNSDSNLDIQSLMEGVNGIIKLNRLSLEGANLDSFIELINEALNIINWLQGLVLGALTDRNASLNNLVGYNSSLNSIAHEYGVKNWEDLPTITILDSAIINLDLDLIKDKLLLAKNIYYINQGKKLTRQSQVNTNKSFIIYNRIKKFIINIGDEWKNKQKLEDAVTNANLLKLYAETRDLKSLTLELRDLIDLEITNISNAIYDFFLDNKDNYSNLYTLFLKGFNLYKDEELVFNENTEYLSDRNFLHWLGSRAAIKLSDFYNEYNQVIDLNAENVVAAIPTLEESVFLNIAEILNGDITTKFKQAYVLAAIENFKQANEEEKHKILETLGIYSQSLLLIMDHPEKLANADIFPLFDNILLTEGSAGTGKSKAVIYYTYQILKKFHQDVVKNIWYTHNTEDSAKSSVLELGMSVSKTLDKKALMSLVYSEYDTIPRDEKDGTVLYNKDSFIEEENGRIWIKYLPTAMQESNLPSLIIIDEISHYDLVDLMLLENFAKKYGITILTYGDFNLSSIIAESKDYGKYGLILSSRSSHFKHSPKLGVNMRTINSQMDKSITNYEEILRTGKFKETILVYHYMNNKVGFNGVMSYRGNLEGLKPYIELMINTLKPSQEDISRKSKIGLIYYNDNSDLVKLIRSNYSDYFELFKGSAAHGLEGLYYIVDNTMSPIEDKTLEVKDTYTGITRAQQGVIVVNSGLNFLNNEETITTSSSYSKTGLLNYSKNRKKIIEKLLSNDNITYTPRIKIDTNNTVNNTVETAPLADQPAIEEGKIILLDGKDYIVKGDEVSSTDNKEISEDTKKLVINIVNNINAEGHELVPFNETDELQIQETLNILNQNQFKLPEDSNSSFTVLLHSFNSFELGVKINDLGKIEFYSDPSTTPLYKYRIDSIIGLMKLFELDYTNPIHDADFYLLKIDILRQALFTITDKTTLNKIISNVLFLDESKVDNIEFGLLSAPLLSKNSKNEWGYDLSNDYGFLMLDKHRDEVTYGNGNPSAESLRINRKTINAIITMSDGKRLALPLFVLGNLKTYISNPLTDLSKYLAKLYNDSTKDASEVNFYKAIIDDKNLKAYPYIQNLAKIYLFNGAAYFKIDDPSWTPANNLLNWGILINNSASSTGHFEYDGSGTYTPISYYLKFGYRISKEIYATQNKKVQDSAGNLYNFANTGHPFVLVTKNPNIVTDLLMIELYEKQLVDPKEPRHVTLVYIMPPKVSTKDYLLNIVERFLHPEKETKRLGSSLTSYYIWKLLLPQLKNNHPLLNKLGDASKTKLIEEIERIKLIDDKTKLDKRRGELVSAVNSDSDWTGAHTSTTVLSLNRLLIYLLFSLVTDVDGNLIKENLLQLSELINIDIFYSAKFKDKLASGKDIVPLYQDLDINNMPTYSINGKSFTVNGKFDSNLFSAKEEFYPILESIASKVENWDVNGKKDTFDYINKTLLNTITLENGMLLPLNSDGTIVPNIYPKDLKTKKDIKSALINKFKTSVDLTSLVDLIYDLLINTLVNYNTLLNIEDSPALLDLINNFIINYNIANNNSLMFKTPTGIYSRSFTPEDLNKVGLAELSINYDLSYFDFTTGNSNYYNYNGVNIEFSSDGNITLHKEVEAVDLNNLDNEVIENSPIILILANNDAGFVEILDMYAINISDTLSQLKGIDDVVSSVDNVLQNSNLSTEEIQLLNLLLSYLKDTNNTVDSCSIIIKGK